MSLTDIQIRSAMPGSRQIKLRDERGLFLFVMPNGGRYWRLRYRYLGREKMLSLGTYPDVSLREARRMRDESREILSKGVDPSAKRQAEKAASAASSQFAAIACDFLASSADGWGEEDRQRKASRYVQNVLSVAQQYPVMPAPHVLLPPDSHQSVIPAQPGVYVAYRRGECWYVGEAKSLRDRLTAASHHVLKDGDLLAYVEMSGARKWERLLAEGWYTAVLRPRHFCGVRNQAD